MAEYDYTVETIQYDISSERKPVEEFLRRLHLSYDADVTYTIVVKAGKEIAATGSMAGNVLKCIGVSPDYQGQTLTNTVVSKLEMEAYYQGIDHLFLFSKPGNRDKFMGLGFQPVGEYPGEVVLLEKPAGRVEEWTAELSRARTGDHSTSLVMNCNPFTRGHRYLVEQAAAKAASESEDVHLFVVHEDRSLFPRNVRFQLVRNGNSDLPNVHVHSGGPYIISSATFPTYFIRDAGEATRIHAGLDLHIYGSRIAPALGITRRMVGQEPYCPVTRAYNRAMSGILPQYGVEVEEIPRLEIGTRAVSASVVRDMIRAGRLQEVRELVPETTWEYLTSPSAAPVLERIQREDRRH